MLGPTDQGHFLKYLTTLGVAIVVASLGLGGFLLQTQSDLLITRDELAKLTPAARDAIDHKQQIVLHVTVYAPYVLGLLVVGGTAMAVVGLIGWRRKQTVLDDRDEVELAKLRREFDLMPMTDQEMLDDLASDADELVQDEIVEHAVSGGDPEPEQVDVPGEPVQADDREPRASAAERVRLAEDALFRKLQAAYPGVRIQQNIRSGSLRVDGVAVVDDEKTFYIFELKITTPANLRHRLTEAAMQLSSTVEALTANPGSYRAVPVFVLLVQGGIEPLGDWRKRAREAFGGLRHQPVVLLYDEDAWADLPPEDFRAAVARRRR